MDDLKNFVNRLGTLCMIQDQDYEVRGIVGAFLIDNVAIIDDEKRNIYTLLQLDNDKMGAVIAGPKGPLRYITCDKYCNLYIGDEIDGTILRHNQIKSMLEYNLETKGPKIIRAYTPDGDMYQLDKMKLTNL